MEAEYPTTNQHTLSKQKAVLESAQPFNKKEVSGLHESTPEVCGVLFREVRPLFRQVIGGEDGRDRADRDAGAAVDALDRIDEQLIDSAEIAFVFLGVDTVDRARIDTGVIFGADAGFSDYISHLKASP
jgi:hypothetical protein